MSKPIKNYVNSEQDRRLIEIEQSIKTINGEMGGLQIDLVEVKVNVCWLKKFFFIVATASLGSLIGVIVNLIFK